MNKYFLMLAAAGLIAAAPAYYAFQAQAEEGSPVTAEQAPTTAEEASIDGEAPVAPEGQEPAAGNPEAGEAAGTNE